MPPTPKSPKDEFHPAAERQDRIGRVAEPDESRIARVARETGSEIAEEELAMRDLATRDLADDDLMEELDDDDLKDMEGPDA